MQSIRRHAVHQQPRTRHRGLARALRGPVAFVSTSFLALASFVAFAHPAAAELKDRIVLKPNTSIEITNPAPLPLGNAYPFTGNGPPDCADGDAAVYCDTIPLTLDAPEADLAKGRYALSLTLSWEGTNYVIPSFGTIPDSDIGMGLWDDPIVEDEDAPTSCGDAEALIDPVWAECQLLGPSGGNPGGDEAYVDTWIGNEDPTRFGMVPKRRDYSITITNFYGAPPTYTLKVSFVVPDKLNDLSIEAPVDLSGATPAGTTSESFAAPSSELPTSLDFGNLGNVDLAPDQDFSGIDLGDLQLDKSEFVRNAIRQGIRRPGNENGLLLWLWLVILPAVALASGAVWLVRRRSSVFAT